MQGHRCKGIANSLWSCFDDGQNNSEKVTMPVHHCKHSGLHVSTDDPRHTYLLAGCTRFSGSCSLAASRGVHLATGSRLCR